MWGNLPQGAGLAFGSAVASCARKQHRQMAGEVEAEEGRLNLWPQQWGGYVTHPEAQGRYHGASGL